MHDHPADNAENFMNVQFESSFEQPMGDRRQPKYAGASYAPQQSIAKIVDSMGVTEMLNHIDRILMLKTKPAAEEKMEPLAKKFLSYPPGERQKYSGLLEWHMERLTQTKNELKNQQISLYTAIQQQHSILLTTMHKFSALLQRECQEKGTLVRVLALHHFNLHTSLTSYMDSRFRDALGERIEAESSLEAELGDEIRELRAEIDGLRDSKDKKWKNLFMLIKDNRVLRRTKGKLMRQLQASTFRQQQLKQNIIELTKQNERYKLLSYASEYEDNGLQKWLKNLSSLIKIEHYIRKEPGKAKRVLEYELENLQISQMEALPDKIEYVIKAIQEAQQLVDYYEDFNDLLAPCKLLLNNYTQTETEYQHISTNTPTTKYINSYIQAKPSHMLQNRCQLKGQVVSVQVGQPGGEDRWVRRDGFKRKESNMSATCRSERGFGSTWGRSGFMGMQYFRVWRTVDETVVPRYIPAFSPAEGTPNYRYMDSRFLFKLQLHEKQINLIVNGHSNPPTSTSKSKEKAPQKRYTQLAPTVPEQILSAYNKPGNGEGQQSARNEDQQRYQYQQQSSRLKLNKRYSYNSRLLPIQSKFKRSSNFDDFERNTEDNFTAGDQDKENSQVNSAYLTILPPASEPVGLPNKEPDIISEERSSVSSRSTKNNQKVAQEIKLDQEQKEEQKEESAESGRLRKIKQKIGTMVRNNTVAILTSRKDSRQHNQPAKLSSFAKSTQKGRSSQRPIQTANPQPTAKPTPRKSIRMATTAAQPSSYRNSHRISRPDTEKSPQSSNNLTINIRRESECTYEDDRYSEDSSCRSTMKAKIMQAGDAGKNQFKGTRTGLIYGAVDRNSTFSFNNVRASYQVAPILEEEAFDDNPNEEEENAIRNRKDKNETPKQPIPPYFQIQGDATQVDPQRVIQKIAHLVYINRQQLRQSQRTLREYIESNLKNIYGMAPQAHFASFNKSLALALESQLSPLALSFMRMLNYHTPAAYQNDIFKIYLILMDKCGSEGMVCEMDLAVKIAEYLTAIFYDQADVADLVREVKSNLTILGLNRLGKGKSKGKVNNMATLANITVNLNQYFLILQSDLRQHCLSTQIYTFLLQILPQNETDLTYPQFSQLLKFLPPTTDLHLHLARLRQYLWRDRNKNSSSRINGMKLHKISLYCSREKWLPVRDIVSKIQGDFRAVMDQGCCLEELVGLWGRLQGGEFGDSLARTACPWIYGLTRNKVELYKDYGSKLSTNLLMLIWLIEINLRISNTNLLWNNLDIISSQTRRLIEKKELGKFINPMREPPIERAKQKQRSYKKEANSEENIGAAGSSKLMNSSQGYLRTSKNMIV